ncbi:hypothetical protein SUGI_0104710 [Cryptomeria japonica]|nr:hypothetical protein SUGI_0104710 [Cryptomeria japonica]
MEYGDDILALLEEDCPSFEEELVDGVMRSLERDVIGVDSVAVLPSSCSNCYLQSDSAHSVTSSSSLVSDPEYFNGIGCQCGCSGEHEQNQLDYLMEASDEELGLSPQVSSAEGEVDLAMENRNWLEDSMESSGLFKEMVDFESVGFEQDLLGVQVEWVPYL